MSMDRLPQTWRDLLGQLASHPSERQRIADALGVNSYTVSRWINNETEPRASTLKKLPDAFPSPYREQLLELIHAEFFPHLSSLTSPGPDRVSTEEVSPEPLARILAAYATVSGRFRAWSIRNLTLQWAIGQLDPEQVGLQLTVVQCVPPLPAHPVRSLCERMGVGTAPWETGVGRHLKFLGAESLSGWTVGRGEPEVVQDTGQKRGPLPVRPDPYEHSTAAWPFQREGKLAGCLLVESTQVNYFTPLRLSWIEVYANALALSFRDEEFYDLRRIALHQVPLRSQEQEYTSLAQFRDRITRLRSDETYQLSEAEAEVLVLQQIEVELLRADA